MKTNYWIVQTDTGWAPRREGASRVSRRVDTQAEAEALATKYLRNNGGGERITQGKDGKIRSKDTINASDPFPPKDTEH